jgi:tRNA threonylcarbamoyladenosine biosynthesis protein TsaB
MRLLAVDTATLSCSVALTEARELVAELILVSARTHARHLAGMILEICRLTDLQLKEVEGFAVTRGPGSFTGLRIGITTVKGLAESAGRRLVGISSLLALAEQSGFRTPLVCPMIDARRGEVYYSVYRLDGSRLCIQEPEQARPPDQVLSQINKPCTFIGSGAQQYRDRIEGELGSLACFPTEADHIIRAATVARLAYERLTAGHNDDTAAFAPTYLRKSDAEINKDRREIYR